MTLIDYKGQKIDPQKINESVTFKLAEKSVKDLTESTGEPVSIMPRIEAIHAGTTRNYVHYPADKLRGDASIQSGVYSWLDPFPKPVIYNHDMETEATGRVAHAAYAEYTQAGKPGIVVIPKITEPKAVQAIKDGRLLTVSIGATTDAAICSICGTNIVEEGFCGHMKGESYDGQVCEWITGNIWFEELSWVNQPADQSAMVTDKESSIFVEPIEANESLDREVQTINEFYSIPNNITIVEALDKGAQPKEGGEDVSKKEVEELLEEKSEDKAVESEEISKEVEEKEEIVSEKETTEVEVEEEEVAEESEVSEEENDEVEKDEDEEFEEDVLDEAEIEDAKSDEFITVENPVTEGFISKEELLKSEAVSESLQLQVDALSKELREFYKKEILEKMELTEDEETNYLSRLENRSLDSLKETLSDLEDGFIRVNKEAKTRVVQKIENPIKEQEVQEKEKRTDKETIQVFTSLFGVNKK